MDNTQSIAKIILCTIVSFFVIVFFCGVGALFVSNHNKVIKGVTYMGQDISGFTKNEIQDFFDKEGKKKLDKMTVILQYGNNSWTIGKDEVGLVANTSEAAELAYSMGRNKSVVQNFLTQLKLLTMKTVVSLEGKYDEERLKSKLLAIKAAIDRDPVNATVHLHSNGMITVGQGVVGKKLDIEPIIEEIHNKFTNLETPEIMILQPDEIEPYVKNSDVDAIDSVLASYTTSFFPGDRGDNIILAASKLNDILLRRGESFSFNSAVGSRTKAAGYKDAPVIVEGKILEDVGGGVCQVSSTLYNAVLLAGLTPTVRAPHFYPSAYCPPGLDATVADDVVDFKFKNPLPHPVYILSSAYGSNLTIYILGTKSDLGGNVIALEQSGSRLSPTIHRIYIQNGVVVTREFMHTDYYDNPADANG